MASWPTGIEIIKGLLATNSLQKVAPSREAATAMLNAAARHLESASLVAQTDPDGAYTLLYDAARKSLAAVLQTQGLRSTSRGGHYAIQEAISAQFSKPPPREAFRPFGRLRRARNQIEMTTSRRLQRTTSPPTNPWSERSMRWRRNSSMYSLCSSIELVAPTSEGESPLLELISCDIGRPMQMLLDVRQDGVGTPADITLVQELRNLGVATT